MTATTTSTAIAEMEPQSNGAASHKPRKIASPSFELDANSPLGFPCPVLGLTGPKWSGKTLFSLSIAPGVHPAGHRFAGQARTLTIDFETSTTGYSTGADKWNAPELLRQRFGGRALLSVDIFTWFRDAILAIEPNRYDVIAADPITDVEDGLIDYVRKHPADFGYTANQFANSTALLMGAAKNYWKRILVDFTARCKTFAFVAHDRMEFIGGRPTGKKIPKGKETLFELASLYLEFSREQVTDGEKPKPPSAKVLKSRFAHTHFNAETGELDIIEILPQRIPVATPVEIRRYVQNPVGLRKTRAGEVSIEKEPTEFERQMLTLEIETQRAAAEQAKLAAAERMASAAQMVQQTGVFQAPDFSAVQHVAAPVIAQQTAVISEPAVSTVIDCPFDTNANATEGAHYDNTLTTYNNSRCADDQVKRIQSLFRQMGEASGGGFTPQHAANIVKNRGVNTLAELTMNAADELASNLMIELQRLHFGKSLDQSNDNNNGHAGSTEAPNAAHAGEDANSKNC